jgi:hypothetical protein
MISRSLRGVTEGPYGMAQLKQNDICQEIGCMSMRERRTILLIISMMVGFVVLLSKVSANPIAVEPEDHLHLGYPLVITLVVLLALVVGSIEYLVVYFWKLRRISRKWHHVLIAFLGVNLITFPITQVVGFWIGNDHGSPAELIAELIPLVLEPMMFIFIFRYLVKKDSLKEELKGKDVWVFVILANLVTFILGLVGIAIVMNV